MKTSPTASLVKRLVPLVLSLPTTLSSPGKITLCRLISWAGKKKCVDVATSDSSVLVPDCTDLASVDPCKAMCATDYTSSAGTLTCTLDYGNGSVAVIGCLPNCPAALCAVDGVPSGMSYECGGIAVLVSYYAKCSDGYDPVDVTSSTLSCVSSWLSRQRRCATLFRLQGLVLPEQCASR